MKTIPEILRGAAQLARQGRWIQGTRFGRAPDNDQLIGCAMGLLDLANATDPAFAYHGIELTRPDVIVWLAKAMPILPDPRHLSATESLAVHYSRFIMGWNDLFGRTSDEVAYVMELAASLYEAAHPPAIVEPVEDFKLPEPELVCV